MKKICLMAVWMGELPDSYPLWKMSAKTNKTVDFWLISDHVEDGKEDNITYVHEDMAHLKQRFQKLFPFDIKLNTPYKICDFKPVYGCAFPEIVQGYDFWGHCDLDIIFGDIRKFLTDELLEQYDKLFDAGFFILYKNTPQMKELYKLSDNKDNMAYSYKKAFCTDYACYFDEYMGMSILGTQYCNTFRDQVTEQMVQDFSWQELGFKSYITKEYFVFRWEAGKLYRHLCDEFGNNIKEKGTEYLFVHIQKRSMEYTFGMEEMDAKKEFWIVPNQYLLKKPAGALYTRQESKEYAKMIAEKDRARSFRNMKQFGVWQYIPHMLRSMRIKSWIVNVKKFF